MKERETQFKLNARYYTLGDLNSNTSVWFVLHGYGQLAKYFLKKFEPLAKSCFVIAPEGLSKFYQEGFSGRVAATWMTKENRLTEIDNYMNYLNAIHEDLGLADHSINVLGFSQGVATASRWALNQSKIKINKLILWSGQFPPDINKSVASDNLSKINIKLTYGTKDPFLTQDMISDQVKFLKALNADPQVTTFNGAHDIDIEHLLEIIKD